ncbi:MAG: cellulase family glycosylhydrolase [Lachnospiraceae bacterium]|nr:cellulase family glycosylhydrolase [Lachnospiraceae bacterium]
MKRSIYLALRKVLAFCLAAALLAGTFHIPARADEPDVPLLENQSETDTLDNGPDDDDLDDDIDDLGDDLNDGELEEIAGIMATSQSISMFSGGSDGSVVSVPAEYISITEIKYDFTAMNHTSGSTDIDFEILVPDGWKYLSGNKRNITITGNTAYSATFEVGVNQYDSQPDPAPGIQNLGFFDFKSSGIEMRVDKITIKDVNGNTHEFEYQIPPILKEGNGVNGLAHIWMGLADRTLICSNADATFWLELHSGLIKLATEDINGGGSAGTYKATMVGQLAEGFRAGLGEWPSQIGEVEFELGKEATYYFEFSSPARFDNFARLITDFPLANADTSKTVINSIKVNGNDVPLIDTPTVNSEGWGSGNLALNLYNNWSGVNDAIDVDSFTSTSMNNIEIKFIVFEQEPDTTDAYLIFGDEDWTGYWGPNANDNSGNITPTFAAVDGFGTYTTKLEFASPVSGMNVFALEITDGEELYPNNFMEIDEVKVNGAAVLVDLTYTTADGDNSRTNLRNTTVSALGEFRTADGKDEGVTWLAIDEPALPISSLEVTFTLKQGYLLGEGPPAAQPFPNLAHITPVPGAHPITRIDYEFTVKRVDNDVNFDFSARFGNWSTRTHGLSLTTNDVGESRNFSITFIGAGASDFISLGDIGDNTLGVVMDLTKMVVTSGGETYDFTFDGSPYDARILRSNNLFGPHNIVNAWRDDPPGTVLFMDDSEEMCFVMQSGGQVGKQITLQTVAAPEQPMPVNIKELVYNFEITGIGSETTLDFKAQTARGSWYTRTMNLSTVSNGEISVNMSPAVDTPALLDMGFIVDNLPASNIELKLKSVEINGRKLDIESGEEPVIKPKEGENSLPNIWTFNGIIAATSAYGEHTRIGGAVGEAALVKAPSAQRIYFYVRGGDSSFTPVTVTNVMSTSRSHDYTTAMGVGWNLGNSLDAPGGTNLATWETDWGNPIVTQALINEVKAKGYDHIRIPFTVGTGNRFTDHGAGTPAGQLRYTINPTWLNRYKEVVQWAVDAGLYVMVNLHHDNWMWLGREGGWNGDLTDWRYRRFSDHWTELAALFADMPDTVMFESINEPEYNSIGLSFMEKHDLINSVMVDIVRNTPGNEDRIIVLPTYLTNHADRNSKPLMTHIAELEDENIIATVHYYNEWVFSQDLGIRLFDEDCFSDRPGYTPRASVNELFDILDEFFVSYGIGVNIGEWGLLTYDRQFDWSQQGEELKYYEHFHYKAKSTGTSVSLWDNGAYIDRNSPTFAWRKPIIGALLSSSAQGIRSATAKGIDTLYFPVSPMIYGVPVIELNLNGRTFTGIAGLTDGGDYIYDSSTNMVILLQTYVDMKYRARTSPFGIFDTIILQFDDGEDWHQYLVATADPSYADASGTRSSGIRIPFDFRGETVMRVEATDSLGRSVGGNNSSWWPYLELGRSQITSTDGAFHVAFPTATSTGSFALTRGFFSDPNAVGHISVKLIFFSGTELIIPVHIDGSAGNSVVTVTGHDPLIIPPPPADDIPGTTVDNDFIINKVEDAEGKGDDEITLTLTELGQDGQGGPDSGGTVISKDTLDNLREDHPDMIINIKLEGLNDGVIISLDTNTITEDAVDINFDMGVNFVNSDTKFYSSTYQGVIVPEESIVITPATTGNFGLDLSITISAAKLAEMNIDANNAKVFYVNKAGNFVEITSVVVNPDDSITFTISSASRYIITEATTLETFDNTPKLPSIPGTSTRPSSSSAPTGTGTVTVAAAKAPAKSIYTVTARSLNERTGPGTNFPTVGMLRQGTILEILEISADGRWALAHTGTWVSIQFIRHVSGPATPEAKLTAAVGNASRYSVQVNLGSRLLVRNASSRQGRVVGTLRRGDIVNVVAIKDGWATINYTSEMPVAYVSLQFLRLIQE